ncbi:nucleolar protein 14 [Planoprotostelium fungivorum]|uniref:Nucleolar protein 14 n=1 Tax=Planoprotostelium fungivorum TaxID=1890364 RepID=A0A2P6NRJ7_9EUKA|nr:nucleolar protein 14 [Planoprotostelium fungivorum]
MAHGGKSTGSKGSSKPGFGQKRTSGGIQKGKKEKAPATNPFNMRFNKPKMVVDGQKIKGIRSNLGQSRTKAIENRNRTLLVEYNQKDKASVFEDNRIGENNSTLTQDEKDLIRYQKETRKRYEKYNLNDEEEELTHLGTSIGEMQKFDDYVVSDDDGEDALDAEIVDKLHFGGLQRANQEEGEDGRKKTREEIYSEIIAKSKLARREKQKLHNEMEDLTDKLDRDYGELQQDLIGLKRQKLSTEEKKERGLGPDDYDKAVREMAFDVRATPSERTKTAEEAAAEEREKLEKLEEERLKRMRPDDEELESVKKLKPKIDRERHMSGDALDDDWNVPVYEEPLRYSLESDPEDEEKEEEGEKQEEEEEEKEEEEEEEEGADDDEDDMVDEEEVEEADEDDREEEKGEKKMIQMTKGGEIPFTLDVPQDQEELQAWTEGRNVTEISTIIQRIRSCNHPSLKEGNKEKMQNFLHILVEHYIVTVSTLHESDTLPLTLLDLLTKHITDMRDISPDSLYKLCRERIVAFHESLSEKLSGESRAVGSCWPSFGHLLFVKLVFSIYPSTDFEHPISTPSILLINEYISRCPIRTPKDFTLALFTCNLVLQVIRETKRYVPEVVTLLVDAIASSAGGGLSTTIPAGFLKLREKKTSASLVVEQLRLDLLAGTMKSKRESFVSDQWRLNAANAAIDLLSKFCDTWSEHPAIDEVNSIVRSALSTDRSPAQLKEKIQQLLDNLAQKSETCVRSRKPLKNLTVRPKEIFRAPLIHNKPGSGLHRGSSDVDVLNMKKLKKRVRVEKKGAIRELRKDNRFMQDVKHKAKMDETRERKSKARKIMASMERQEAEGKQLDRMKKKLNPKKKSAF